MKISRSSIHLEHGIHCSRRHMLEKMGALQILAQAVCSSSKTISQNTNSAPRQQRAQSSEAVAKKIINA